MCTRDFLDHFTHSFLVRDPAKTIASMFKQWPDFHLKETGFIEQRSLFDRLSDKFVETPPALDSNDLLEDPGRMVEAWCDAVGIPFIPEALQWEPGAREEVSFWDGGSFHENLRNSDGLKPQPRAHMDISKAPDRVRETYEIVLPHYEHLCAHRLAASTTKPAHVSSFLEY